MESKDHRKIMDEKKKISPICLTGFILSLLSPVACLGGLSLYFLRGSARLFGSFHNKLISLNCVIVLVIIFTILGLILSVIGIKSLKNGYGGKRIAVTGIVVSVLMIVSFLFGVSLVWYENAHRESPPTTGYAEKAS